MLGNGGPIARRPAKNLPKGAWYTPAACKIRISFLPKAESAGNKAIRWGESGWAGGAVERI